MLTFGPFIVTHNPIFIDISNIYIFETITLFQTILCSPYLRCNNIFLRRVIDRSLILNNEIVEIVLCHDILLQHSSSSAVLLVNQCSSALQLLLVNQCSSALQLLLVNQCSSALQLLLVNQCSSALQLLYSCYGLCISI